jgi:hypothetical protein
MPLIKSKSRRAFVSNLKAELGAGKPRDQALAIAYAVKRRARRAGGGSIFDYSGVGEAMPEHIGREMVVDPLVTVPKRMLYDLPKEAVEQAQSNPLPGLRREDYTDIPADTSPDPRSPLGGVGISAPRVGWQPVDPMVGSSLEAATNVAAAPLVGAPVAKAGETVLGAGAMRKAPTAADEIDQIIAAERNLKGATNEPAAAPAAAIEPAAAPVPGPVGPGGGGAAGIRGLPEAQTAATRWAGERKPLEGIPGPLKIGEDYFVPGPIGKVHDVAEEYMRTHRPEIEFAPPTRYHPIDPEHSKAIAQAYEEMKHTPKDPATVASYNALIDETAKQYQAIKATGLKIEPIPAGAPDPYAANPRLAAIDVAENNHLWFFPTEGGFGTVNKITDNPMLRKTGEKIGDHELLANDMFRVVHDYFGHLKEGHGFRAPGEDNAWRTHSAMYSDLARPAMTTETRGQNSWVNYGPHGEKNRTASGADTIYADQKVGLMPDWTMYDKGSAPPMMYHGSAADYIKPDLSKIGSGQGEMAYGAGYYGSKAERVAKRYRDMQAEGESPGHMYKWAIEEEPGKFIDWDKPFAKQSRHVQELLRNEVENSVANQKKALQRGIAKLKKGDIGRYAGRPGGAMMAQRDLEEMQRKLETLSAKDLPGKEIYKRMGLPAKDQTEAYTKASQRLKEIGIPGIHYKDTSSTAGDAGVRNYVVWDPRVLRLLRKYGVTGLPAAGVAAGAAQQEERAAGGRVVDRLARRIRKAGGGSFGVYSPGEEAELDEPVAATVIRGAAKHLATLPKRAFEASETMRRGEGYDPGPVLEAATLPMGTGAVAGVPVRGAEMALGAGPVRRIADDTGAAMATARRAKAYAEPEYNPSGGLIFNKGVEAPPNPAVQTVADPYRMMFPGVYRNPRIIAEEAAARVGPEDPAMKRLFGITRGDLREMAQGRVGNEEPLVRTAKNPKGSLSAQNIQTPQNTQRLQDILGEAGKHEGLRTADAWYIMDPVYRRMVELHGPEAAERYRLFNTTTAMASPGSDVMTEIQRGTGAHWLHNQGRFEDFMKYAGIPEDMRGRVKFPADMRYMAGHPYHRTSQGEPMRKFLESGAIQSDAPKVPLYAHASGVPETGFQTTGPVGDAHFSRGVGLADTRKGPTDVGSSFSRAEYQTLQPWWQHEVAGPSGLESVPAQARLWTALGPQTGVMSELGAPKLELLAKQIMAAAQRLRISPEQARDLVLSGKAGAGLLGGAVAAPAVMDAMRERQAGGSVSAAMNVAREIKRAKGGKVHLGPIVGHTDGRADKVPMEVPNGSYVLTADHCSAMGEGNTLAGFEKLKKMFPKSVAAYKAAKARGPVQRATGGRVPILAADGEFVICPEDIVDRWGDLDRGHRILDHWQTSERKKHIATLSKLAPPAQD